MRIVVQRASHASVEVDGVTTASIGRGLVLFLAVAKLDSELDADYLINKVIHLRIFPDEARNKMDRSVLDIAGAILVVSQFTLYGDCRKGRRPSFDRAAPPEQALGLYNYFVKRLITYGLAVQTGVFQAQMNVSLLNQGPITLLLDSKKFELE